MSNMEGVVNKIIGKPHVDINRCGARTRAGGSCMRYAMKNGRCRLHGGLSTGPRNPRVKHGMYSKRALEEKKLLRQLLSNAKGLSYPTENMDKQE